MTSPNVTRTVTQTEDTRTVTRTVQFGDEATPPLPAEPTPTAAPPRPHPVPVLRVLKTAYRRWIAAGGTPAIYQRFTVSGGIITHLP